jgi:poly(A) polymerase
MLKSMLPNFQRKVEKNIDYKRDIECMLSPFGSYALGGYIRGADIDVVLVCPTMVRRTDFYKLFPELLKQQPTITDVEVRNN